MLLKNGSCAQSRDHRCTELESPDEALRTRGGCWISPMGGSSYSPHPPWLPAGLSPSGGRMLVSLGLAHTLSDPPGWPVGLGTGCVRVSQAGPDSCLTPLRSGGPGRSLGPLCETSRPDSHSPTPVSCQGLPPFSGDASDGRSSEGRAGGSQRWWASGLRTEAPLWGLGLLVARRIIPTSIVGAGAGPWEDAPEALLGPWRATSGVFTGCPTLGVIEKAASF